MPESKAPPHLKLLRTVEPDTDPRPVQARLFPDHGPWLFAALDMSSISRGRFHELLQMVRPRLVVDLRPVPRFDIDGMTRALVFDWLEASGATYRDFAGLHRIESRSDARLNPAIVADGLAKMLSGKDEARGPVFVLWDDADRVSEYSRLIPGRLPRTAKHGWEVLAV